MKLDISTDDLRRAISIREQIEVLQAELAGLLRGAGPRRGRPPLALSRASKPKAKRNISPEGRARIAEAAKRRWALERANKEKAAKTEKKAK